MGQDAVTVGLFQNWNMAVDQKLPYGKSCVERSTVIIQYFDQRFRFIH
jgi:hypothetical protein